MGKVRRSGGRTTESGAEDVAATDGGSPGEAGLVGTAGTGTHAAVGADEPDGSPAVASLDDVERELARTRAALADLATGVQAVLERQDRAARGLNLSSFGAYAIFTLLLAGGFTLIYRARAGGLATERDDAVAARAALVADVAARTAALAARTEAEGRATALWTVVESGRREELVARAAEADAPGLSPVEAAALRRAVDDARRSLSDEASTAGRDAQRGGQWARSAEAFRRALAVEPPGPRRGELGYKLGLGLLRAGDAEGASRALTDAAGAGGEAAGADLYFLLGAAHEARRDDVHAAEAYRKFNEGHPGHPLAPAARARLGWIAARNGGAARPAVTTPPGSSPAVTSPAPIRPATAPRPLAPAKPKAPVGGPTSADSLQ